MNVHPRKDKQIFGMAYIINCALRACKKSLIDKAKNTKLDSEFEEFRKSSFLLCNESDYIIDKYGEDILKAVEDTDGNFFRAVAGVLQIAERCFENKKNTDKLYKMFYLQDYMDYVCERENGDE